MDLHSVGTTLFNYALRGGMFAAAAGMLFISLTSAVGGLRQPTTERLLIVLGDYFLIGAAIGALVGLAVVLRDRRQ